MTYLIRYYSIKMLQHGPEQRGSSRRRAATLLVVTALLVSLGVYGAIGAAGQIATTPHSIIAKGESSCLKCHYGIYVEMVSTNHGRTIVRELQTIKNDGPDANACLVCHGKRERWGSFGMADWAVWFQNSTVPVNQSRWVSLGYTQVPFPYGKGYSGVWDNSTAATASSTFSIDMYSATAGASILANVTFFDYAADNSDILMILSEGSSGHYSASVSGIYPDYFRIQLSSNMDLTAGSLTVSSDGVSYEVSATGKYVLSLNNGSTVTLAQLMKNETTEVWAWDRYVDDWNFHTGAYTKVAKMSSVWENVRTIATATFPTRGIPIEYLGVTGEKSSCSSTQGLCHSTLQMINLTSQGKLPETRAAYGYLPYYEHSMNLSTDSSKTCGICHAPMFADGPTTHYTGYCYSCHNSHDVKK